jgi:hypothetical protein
MRGAEEQTTNRSGDRRLVGASLVALLLAFRSYLEPGLSNLMRTPVVISVACGRWDVLAHHGGQ